MREYEQFTEIMEHTREAIRSKDPNQSIIYSVGCLVWGWRQEYLKEPLSYYISSKRYESLKEELKGYKSKIDTGGHSKEAESQIQRAESWVETALAHRVRMPNPKNRVF